MICQLGDIVFEGLKSFSGFSTTDEALYAEHELLNTKSVLQPVGMALKQGSIEIMLRQEFCVVKDEVDKLYKYQAGNKVLTLLWGDSRIIADFVITTIEKTDEYVLPDGSLVQCSLAIGLKEWYVPDKLVQQQTEARNNAPAVGDKKPPVKTNRSNAGNCSQNVSKNMATIESRAGDINRYVRKYNVDVTVNNIIVLDCNMIDTGCDKLQAINNTAGSCMSDIKNDAAIKITAVKTQSDSVRTVAKNLTSNRFYYGSAANGIITMKQVNDTLQASVVALKTTLNPVIATSITRMPDLTNNING